MLGCPALESMELYDLVVLRGPCFLEITSSKLKTLKLNGHCMITDGIRFVFPNLKTELPYVAMEYFVFVLIAFSILYISTNFIGIIATCSVHVAVPRDFASRSEMQISDAGAACEEV
ncbi:hypothetical protein RDI58_026933 [Solanum bulbocastanum]|uniref:Uncharacterized protein n=1 Tax=Solanum bulbocastanum TaxID=147425 RepID=A0AAN8Y1X1_SOLBU